MQNQYIVKQNKMPLVSFIITCYNIPIEMLKECINSIFVLSLSRDEREIILIDDGSDLNIIDELVNVRDEIIYLRQSNQGLSAARNAGIRIASGQYIQFIDGDDYLIHTAYEHCLDLVRYHDPDIVMFNFTNKDIKGKNAPYTYNGPIDGAEYLRHNNLRATAWGYIFKRIILLDLRFTLGIYHEDEEFTPQLLLRAEKVFCTDSKAYFYRKRKTSITHRQDKHSLVKRLNDTETIIYNLYELSTTIPANDKIALERRIAQLTMDYIYNIIIQTHSEHNLNKRLDRLRKDGLFPLPYKNYTTKYKWFRKMINNDKGRKLLIKI